MKRPPGGRGRTLAGLALALLLVLGVPPLGAASPKDGKSPDNGGTPAAPAGSDSGAAGAPESDGGASGAQGSAPEEVPEAPTAPEEGETPLVDPALLEEPVLDEPPLELFLFDEEDLVSAASRKTSKLSEAPGTVTLLSREDLDSFGVVTLGDLLRYISSSILVPGTVDTGVEFRGVQQPFNNKILLMRDGRVLNSVYRGDFSLDLAQPLDDVHRVEVVRGPGSALYGANAFAGFINLVTMKGEEVDGVQSRSVLGTDGLWYQNALAGAKAGKLDWIVSARVASTDGQDPVNPSRPNDGHKDAMLQGRLSGDTWFVDLGYLDVEAGSPGTFAFPTSKDTYDTRRFTLDGKKTWELGDRFKLAVRAYYTSADSVYKFVSLDLPNCDGEDPFCKVAGDAFGAITDVVDENGQPLPPEVRRRYEIFLNNPPQLRAKAENGDPDVYIDRATYDAWKAGTLGDRVDLQTSRESRSFGEFQFDWRVTRGNYLLMGGGLQLDGVQNSDVGDHRFRDAWVFLEDEQRFLDDRLIGLASVRMDQHSYFGRTASPRLSLIWSPRFGKGAEKLVERARPPFYLKAGYGKAFRSPNFVELFGQTRVGPEAEIFGQDRPGAAFLQGNPDLAQESIATLEMQAHWEPGRTVESTLTLFRYRMQDEVILDVDRDVVFVFQPVTRLPLPFPENAELMFDPALADVPVSARFTNVAEGSRGRGMELELSWSPRKRLPGLSVWGNFSRVDVDRPVDLDLVLEVHPESGRLTSVHYDVLRESGVQDTLNLGVLYRPPDGHWMLHYRARTIGRFAGSGLLDGARTAHDITLGLDAGRFSARLTGLNVTGTDYLRNSTDGTYPDLRADWLLILGYRWEF